MIGQTEFFITPQCTKHTYGACIIIVHMHGAYVRFFACENLRNSATDRHYGWTISLVWLRFRVSHWYCKHKPIVIELWGCICPSWIQSAKLSFSSLDATGPKQTAPCKPSGTKIARSMLTLWALWWKRPAKRQCCPPSTQIIEQQR